MSEPLNLAGIQLALFELIWPVFRWIEAIFIRTDSGLCVVHLQVSREPTQPEEGDCRRILGEIFDAALGETALHLRVTHGKGPTAPTAGREIMSDEIFKMIAKECASWRLKRGR